jgi:acyl carrier protein
MNQAHRADVIGGVRAALLQIEPRLTERDLRANASIVDDLGIDSIRIVDLTLALQDIFGCSGAPVQEWADEQERSGQCYTIASLSERCGSWLAEAPPGASASL